MQLIFSFTALKANITVITIYMLATQNKNNEIINTLFKEELHLVTASNC